MATKLGSYYGVTNTSRGPIDVPGVARTGPAMRAGDPRLGHHSGVDVAKKRKSLARSSA